MTMKNRLISYLILIASLSGSSITFNVNMSQQDVGDEGPSLWMGSFYPDAGFIMTDEDEDGIWSYTIDLDPGDYTYKYRNGHWTSWDLGSGWEEVPQECESGQFGDRIVTLGDDELVLDPLCFGSCTNECFETIYSNVTFIVDMEDENLSDDDIVYIQGSFNGWCGYCNPMSDINDDGIWELTLELPIGEYEYLFTTNGWNGLQAGAPQGSECDWLPSDEFANYGFALLEDEDLLLGPYCFGTCWQTCQPPAEVDITFNVDMTDQTIDELGVYIIGSFQDVPWDSFLPTLMLDEDNDGIYSATISLLSDEYIEYKFQNGLNVETDSNIGACGNNLSSMCTNPGPGCNNRFYQIPSCSLNDSNECILDDINLDPEGFNSCGYTVNTVYFDIDLNDTLYPYEDYAICGLNGSWNASEDGSWIGFGLELSDDDGDGILNGSMDLGPGDYEFVVFCSGESDDFSGWGLQFETTPGSDCDFDSSDEYGNYGFTLENADLNISYCAGSCASSCSEDNSCLNNGDVNLDGTLNVVDLVAIVAHILQSNILSDDVVCRADGNNDEVVNVVDIVYYVSIILSRN